jgi:hypothetical protein
VTVSLSVTDVNEVVNSAPVIAGGQMLSYNENQAANGLVGTVAASDDNAVTAFRFAANGLQTSADGYYSIDNAGLVRITAAGVAAGLANNDYEITPNSFTYAIEAGDASGIWSPATNVVFEVADRPDTPPVLTGPGARPAPRRPSAFPRTRRRSLRSLPTSRSAAGQSPEATTRAALRSTARAGSPSSALRTMMRQATATRTTATS